MRRIRQPHANRYAGTIDGKYARHRFKGRSANETSRFANLPLCPWSACLAELYKTFLHPRFRGVFPNTKGYSRLVRATGEKARTKDDFFAPHPDFWGDSPDELILHTPWQHFGQKTSKVYRKTMQNVDFEHRLPIKQPKSGQGVSRHVIPHAQAGVFP